MDNEFLFFFAGPLSTWHRSNFTLDGITFNTIEQYMTYHKALLFNSKDIAQQILNTSDPRQQKKLGQSVKGFDNVWWNENCLQLSFRCNHAKFEQNKRLYDMLMNTSPSIMVNVSEFDKVWGIGLDEKTAYKTPESDWPGTNWLGRTLTHLRDHFAIEEAIAQEEAV